MGVTATEHPTHGTEEDAPGKTAVVGDMDHGALKAALHHAHCTDAGNAEVFTFLYRDVVRYDHKKRRWLVWGGHRWIPDADDAVQRMALDVARLRFKAAMDTGLPEEDRKRLAAHAIRSESAQRLDAMLKIARSMVPVADDGKTWDKTPWLLGVPNGVVDLRTGELRDGRPEDRITMQAGVEYDSTATCPRFSRFLCEILRPVDEPVEGGAFGPEAIANAQFVLDLAGYSLTGEPRLHWILFLIGIGGNGKGTMLDEFAAAAGDYARSLEATAIKAHKYDRHSTEVAHLDGSRFAYCEELGDSKLNTNRLKALSGSSVVTARKTYRDPSDLDVTWVLWLTTNGLPRFEDASWGWWRRVKVLNFPHIFNEKMEPDLKEKLKAERVGILAALVRGAMRYYAAQGITLPKSVEDATSEYRTDTDPLQALFEAGVLVEDATARMATADLFAAYQGWANATGVLPERRYGQDGFAKALSGRFPRAKWAGGVRGFVGVRLGQVPE
jgi:putative DNA primase/helicase